MDGRFTYQNIELAYAIEGQGADVVLLHGWGCDHTIWQQTIDLLKEHRRVIAIDFAGFGHSDEPSSVWGVEEYTRSIEALLCSLGVNRPTLIGHSFGGRVSIVFASRNDVERVVLTDAAGVKPRRKFGYYRKVYSFKLMKHLLPLLIGRQKAQMLIDQRRQKSGSSDYNRATPMMRAILSKCVNEDLQQLMPSVKSPVLLFWGDKDTATPITDAYIMSKRMPDTVMVVAEGAGHFAMLEQPALWFKSLCSFLNIE